MLCEALLSNQAKKMLIWNNLWSISFKKTSKSVVLLLGTFAPRILKLENIGVYNKCHLPRAVHSFRSVQATTTSRTGTKQNERQMKKIKCVRVKILAVWGL